MHNYDKKMCPSSPCVMTSGGIQPGDIHDCPGCGVQSHRPFRHLQGPPRQYTQHPQLAGRIPEHLGRGLRCLCIVSDWHIHGWQADEGDRDADHDFCPTHLC